MHGWRHQLQAGRSAQVEVRRNAETQTDTSTTASTGTKANFGTVMSSIKAGKTNVGAITGLTAVGKVNVVKVGDLAKGNNMQALDRQSPTIRPTSQACRRPSAATLRRRPSWTLSRSSLDAS